jgi:hypothetical protein
LEHCAAERTSPVEVTQEIVMKRARKCGWVMPLAAGLLFVATGIATAQAPDQPLNEHPSNTTKQNSDSGTRPENMGASGWTGGRKDTSPHPHAETTGSNPGNINEDSEYATGTDLKGPPAQFPPARTPE